MLEIIKRKIFSLDLILAFIVFLALSFKDFFLSCVSYLSLSFNHQIPLTWDFTSLNNLLPYKDIYFPYGILFYLKNINPIFSNIYLFLPPLLFVGIYAVLRSIFKNRIIFLLSFITFFLFINRFTGTENFARYGIILCFSLLTSYIFYKNFGNKAFFLLGILIGAIFSLAQDQGIYSILIFIALLIFTHRSIFFRLTITALGIVIGFFPFFIFLQLNGITYDFFLFLKHLPDFTLYAKTPFIPFAASTDNLFTFGSIFITTIVLSYKIFFLKKKLSFIYYLELSLLLILIFLEQKSIIRSIDKQITFVAFFLYIILIADLLKGKLGNLILALFFVFISTLILLGFGLNPFINYKLDYKQSLINSFIKNNINDFLFNKSKLCLDENLNKLITKKNTKFEKVKKIIDEDSIGETKIFNYLSDPIFYVLFNQKPPYYFTIFEATPLYAQKSNIKYIEDNKVVYIIYNTDALKIQDGVPDTVRTKVLYGYVLSNFQIMDRIDNFIIYKKRND